MLKKFLLKYFSLLLLFFFCNICSAAEPAQNNISLIDAVRLTIKNQPNIKIQEQEVEIKKGALQTAKGEFDTAVSAFIGAEHKELTYPASEKIKGIIEKLKTDTTTYGVNLNKKLRGGVKIVPQLDVTYTNSSTSPINQYEPTNIGRINFTITVPLLKGKGKKVTTATETAAKKEYEASVLQLRHKTSEYILNTVSTYWEYLASYKILKKRKEAEKNAKRLVVNTQKLIAADKSPGSDLEQIAANSEDKTADRINAEQSFFEAKQKLGIALGISFEKIKQLPLPSDNFSIPQKNNMIDYDKIFEKIIKQALQNRADFLSAKKQEEADKILFEASKNNLLPQIDLKLNAGYEGLSENGNYADTLSALQNNVAGLNYSALLNYEIPVANNIAKGILSQKKAAYNQSIISKKELERNICSNVITALSDLNNGKLSLIKSEKAVLFYKKAVKNEENKLIMGISTIFDLISIEDKLINSALKVISSELKLNKALAYLRFETGSLILNKQNYDSIGIEELTTIPFVN